MENLPLSEKLRKAQNWFYNSGIQNVDREESLNGGFNSWYDPKAKEYAYIFSEITGYALTALVHLHHHGDPRDDLLQRGELATAWLTKQATHPSGGVRTRYFYKEVPGMYTGYDWKNGTLYTFDAGVVLFGVTNLYKTQANPDYLNYARTVAEFILAMQKPEGGFYAYFLPTIPEKVDVPDKWSTQSGAYHTKLALGLLRLFELTGDERYREAAVNTCEFALNFQRPSGRFVTYRREGDTHMHPHCYSGEGLLFAGQFLNEPRYVEAARRAAAWSLNSQMASGGTPSMYYKSKKEFGPYERSDELAQVLRLSTLTLDDSYLPRMQKLRDRLLQFQVESDDPAADGGFRYGWDEDGTEYHHVNSWCTMFALQALQMLAQRESGLVPKCDFLV